MSIQERVLSGLIIKIISLPFRLPIIKVYLDPLPRIINHTTAYVRLEVYNIGWGSAPKVSVRMSVPPEIAHQQIPLAWAGSPAGEQKEKMLFCSDQPEYVDVLYSASDGKCWHSTDIITTHDNYTSRSGQHYRCGPVLNHVGQQVISPYKCIVMFNDGKKILKQYNVTINRGDCSKPPTLTLSPIDTGVFAKMIGLAKRLARHIVCGLYCPYRKPRCFSS